MKVLSVIHSCLKYAYILIGNRKQTGLFHLTFIEKNNLREWAVWNALISNGCSKFRGNVLCIMFGDCHNHTGLDSGLDHRTFGQRTFILVIFNDNKQWSTGTLWTGQHVVIMSRVRFILAYTYCRGRKLGNKNKRLVELK